MIFAALCAYADPREHCMGECSLNGRLMPFMMCRIDMPWAPKALGYLLGGAAAEGIFDLKELPALFSKVEETESRRLLASAIFKTVRVQSHNTQCCYEAATCTTAALTSGLGVSQH